MAREVVKQLEGRELDLITNAALQMKAALERMEQVKADGLVREQHFQELLQMALGAEETADLTLDMATGEVYREKRDQAPPPRRRRATTKTKKRAR